MKKFRHRIVTIVGIVFGLIVLAAPAWARDTLHSKGQSAFAFFSSTDPSGCISTDVGVSASDSAVISHDLPGPPNLSSGSGALIFISQFDSCNFILLVAASCSNSAPLADPDFQVSGGNLGSATLNTTLDCFDSSSGAPLFNVSVALTWVGGDNVFLESSRFLIRSPGFSSNSHLSGTFRPAEASGSVSDGTTNFTPKSSDFADIESVKSGLVTID